MSVIASRRSSREVWLILFRSRFLRLAVVFFFAGTAGAESIVRELVCLCKRCRRPPRSRLSAGADRVVSSLRRSSSGNQVARPVIPGMKNRPLVLALGCLLKLVLLPTNEDDDDDDDVDDDDDDDAEQASDGAVEEDLDDCDESNSRSYWLSYWLSLSLLPFLLLLLLLLLLLSVMVERERACAVSVSRVD